MVGLFGEEAGERDASVMFDRLDVDKSGKLTLEEIATWYFQQSDIIKARRRRDRKGAMVSRGVSDKDLKQDETLVQSLNQAFEQEQVKVEFREKYQREEKETKLQKLLEQRNKQREKFDLHAKQFNIEPTESPPAYSEDAGQREAE